MRYLSDKELVDRVVAKQFVMEDEEKRGEALNRKCSIRKVDLSESQLNETFNERKCEDIGYNSWKEFFEKGLDKKCSEDLIKYSTKDCGTFYYSSLEEFYKENPNCCEVSNAPIYDYSRFSQGLIESPGDGIFEKLFAMDTTYVQLVPKPDPDSPRIAINHCGDIKRIFERNGHPILLRKSLKTN